MTAGLFISCSAVFLKPNHRAGLRQGWPAFVLSANQESRLFGFRVRGSEGPAGSGAGKAPASEPQVAAPGCGAGSEPAPRARGATCPEAAVLPCAPLPGLGLGLGRRRVWPGPPAPGATALPSPPDPLCSAPARPAAPRCILSFPLTTLKKENIFRKHEKLPNTG